MQEFCSCLAISEYRFKVILFGTATSWRSEGDAAGVGTEMDGTEKLLSDPMPSKEHMTDSVHRRLKDNGFVRFTGRIKFTLVNFLGISELNEKLC
jgi:hypothetical protein